MDKKHIVIAIDGPVAAGKGTIATKLASILDGLYLYTGAMYRILALLCIEQGIDMHNEQAVIALLPLLTISYDKEKIFFNGRDITDRIKEDDTASGSSVVAVYPQVRAAMVTKQQAIGELALSQGIPVIIEGRDTATKVFPEAELKVYLTASPEARAKRRLSQYQQQGRTVSFDEVLEEIHVRDKRDMLRETDPLPSNPKELGYFIVDDSQMSEADTLETIYEELRRRGLLL